MGAWDDFSKKYHLTGADWAEWRRTKELYSDGCSFHCVQCGRTVTLTPLLCFIFKKGKMPQLCDDCSTARRRSVKSMGH
jgi:hypothetical protein